MSIESKPTQKKRSFPIIAGIIVVIASIWFLLPESTQAELPEKEKVEQEKILKDIEEYNLESYSKFSADKRVSIIVSLLNKSEILDEKDLENTRIFLSEMSQTKDKSLKVTEVFRWAEMEKKNSPDDFVKHIDLIRFKEGFTDWDGSYRPLEKLLKDSMYYPESYEHVKTVYHTVLHSKEKGFRPYAKITTTFKGKNPYGGVVIEPVSAIVDLHTLDISIIEE